MFPNWTKGQVEKSKIWDAIHGPNDKTCKIYYVDVSSEGQFTGADHFEASSDNERSWSFILGKVQIQSSVFLIAVQFTRLTGHTAEQ